MTISLSGVTVREQEALQCLLDLSIDRCCHEHYLPKELILIFSISYCSADPTYDRVFAVLCTDGDGAACHAFLTHKKKMVRSSLDHVGYVDYVDPDHVDQDLRLFPQAQAATLTIAQAFNLAYELCRNERPANRFSFTKKHVLTEFPKKDENCPDKLLRRFRHAAIMSSACCVCRVVVQIDSIAEDASCCENVTFKF